MPVSFRKTFRKKFVQIKKKSYARGYIKNTKIIDIGKFGTEKKKGKTESGKMDVRLSDEIKSSFF